MTRIHSSHSKIFTIEIFICLNIGFRSRDHLSQFESGNKCFTMFKLFQMQKKKVFFKWVRSLFEGFESAVKESITTELYMRVRTQIKRARRWCVMGCPSFYHEIGDCDVCMQMREREKKTKQIQIFDDKKEKKKEIRNARIGKNSLLSLNVEKMLFFFFYGRTKHRVHIVVKQLYLCLSGLEFYNIFFSTVVNQFDAVGEVFLRNPPKGTCQKSKSIKVFCYIRFGPMLKTFCNERKFGRFWDGKFKCCEYETGIKGVCGG